MSKGFFVYLFLVQVTFDLRGIDLELWSMILLFNLLGVGVIEEVSSRLERRSGLLRLQKQRAEVRQEGFRLKMLWVKRFGWASLN